MRLSRLKLAGFKSFADTATLQFKDNRTAIVGPNGCGKSNVIDAIRWVMGESSAKQLRGGNMQDVIFAGTSQRKPVGLASVELHFDNTYGKLGGEYNAYTELSVKRQVTREGKSDYFLNGTRCRRRDITDIFLGTGLGPRSYAVIEQGMINRLVDAKPDEMRVFIEEAAGISRYQARRKETLQHLDLTQANLERLNDIAQELQVQIQSLKKQAAQAEHYQQLQQQILGYKTQLFSEQYVQASDRLQQLTQSIEALRQQLQLQQQALEQIEIESHLLQQDIQQQLPQAEQLQQTWQHALQQHQHLLWQVEQDQQQQQHFVQVLSELTQQQQDLDTQLQQLEAQLAPLEQLQAQTEQQLKAVQSTMEIGQNQLAHAQQQFAQQQQHYQAKQQQLSQLQQQQQQIEYQWQQSQKTVQRSNAVLAQLQLQYYHLDQEDHQQELAQLQQQATALQQQYAEVEHLIQLVEQQLQQGQSHHAALQQQQQAAHLLQKNLSREISHTSGLLQNLSGRQGDAAQKPLLEMLCLSPEGQSYSHLIEKMLGAWLMADVVEQLDAARAAARQLCPAVTPSPHTMTGLAPLSTWITAPSHSLWQQVWIAEDVNQSFALIKQVSMPSTLSIISKDGYWLGPDWMIDLNQQQDSAQGQLHYRLHLDQLRVQYEQVSAELAPLQQQLGAREPILLTLQQQRAELEQQQQQLQQAQAQAQAQQIRLQTLEDSHQHKQQQLQQQIHAMEQQLLEDQNEAQLLETDLISLKLKVQQHQPETQALQAQFEQQQQHVSRQQQQLQQDAQQLNRLELLRQQQQAQQALLAQDIQFKQQQQQGLKQQGLTQAQQQQLGQQRLATATVQEQALRQQAEQEHQAWQQWQQQLLAG
jgi:chromosome segregation protein